MHTYKERNNFNRFSKATDMEVLFLEKIMCFVLSCVTYNIKCFGKVKKLFHSITGSHITKNFQAGTLKIVLIGTQVLVPL